MSDGDDLERLLSRLALGEEEASRETLERVYAELRAIASRHLSRERADHTLQPTALVHEAYLRLLGGSPQSLASRAQFFHAAARAMRQILVDHARSRARKKRGGGQVRKRVDVEQLTSGDNPDEFLAVEEALCRLEEEDARAASVVRLRVFAGLGNEESAQVLGVSKRTVEREWAYARSWLWKALQ